MSCTHALGAQLGTHAPSSARQKDSLPLAAVIRTNDLTKVLKMKVDRKWDIISSELGKNSKTQSC